MKSINLSETILLSCLVFSQAVFADVKTNAEAPPDNWNGPEQRSVSGLSDDKMVTMNQTNQMRCWQWGRLIIQVNDLHPVSAQKGEFMVKGSNKLRAYDFGDTFCLYLGGQ